MIFLNKRLKIFQNERLKEEMVGRERMEREFQLAREIQKNLRENNYG